MEEVANTSIIGVEPQTLELSSELSKEVRESTAHVTRLVVEEVSQRSSFRQEKNGVLENRDVYRFFSDHEIAALRKGQVPEHSTQMREKRKAKFANQAPISGWPLWLSDRPASHPSGTWPVLETNPSNVTRNLHKKEHIVYGLEV